MYILCIYDAKEGGDIIIKTTDYRERSLSEELISNVVNDLCRINFAKKSEAVEWINHKYGSRCALAVAATYMGMSVKETNTVLDKLGFGKLYARNQYDALVIYSINVNQSLLEVVRWFKREIELEDECGIELDS